MPGKGCLLRKALRRAERATQAGGEAGELGVALPPAKIARITPEAIASLEEAKEAGLLNRPERIWSEVPPLSALAKPDRQKAMQLCQAMYEAVEENNNEPVSISNLGAHYKVQRVKKDPLFQNQRLLDIVQRHTDVFDLIPDGVTANGWAIKIKDGLRMLSLADEDTPESANFEAAFLPDRIEAPSDREEATQAFRIESIIALYKRGGKVQLNDLGQDKNVINSRAVIGGSSRKLLELYRAFPVNFALEDLGNGNFNIELLSTDVSDTSMLPYMAVYQQAKGTKTSSSAPTAEPGSARERLINGVKAFQRNGLQNKMKWYTYCSNSGSLSFDPNRHPDEFLEEFLTAAKADMLPEPDEALVAEIAKKGADRPSKGKGKGGKAKGGTWVPGPAPCGGKPSWGAGRASSWGDDWDWDWWSDPGFAEAMQSFMMWWAKGGKAKGKGEQGCAKGAKAAGGKGGMDKGGMDKGGMDKGGCKGGIGPGNGNAWRSPWWGAWS